jgi:hypothetical protein
MAPVDWEPVDRDACRPASRAARLLRDIQRAIEAHERITGGAPAVPIETRVEFNGPESARVHRRLRAADGSETGEVVTVVLDGGRWRVVAVDPAP